MRNRIYRADAFAQQTGDVTRPVNGDGIEWADKASFLGANGNAGPAVDAGVPANLEQDGLGFTHTFLYSELGSK
jgi:hypothetical protein